MIDQCAGLRLANWLRGQGHDVADASEMRPDPGDQALLKHAAAEGRVLVTIDTDFGELIYVEGITHAGLVRLPDVPAEQRIAIMSNLLERHREALEAQAVITIRGGRLRISQYPLA